MTQAVVWTYFLLIVGTMLVFISYWLVAEALFPAFVRRTRDQYKRPGKATLLGLLMVAPLFGVGLWFGKLNFPIGTFGTTGLIVVLGLLGSSGLSLRIGQGMPSPTDESQPWRRVLRGGTILAFTFLLPFIGWFVILPWTLVSGFAAAITSFSSGRPEPQPAVPATAPKEVVG
jgi:hypothetical protein